MEQREDVAKEIKAAQEKWKLITNINDQIREREEWIDMLSNEISDHYAKAEELRNE